MNLDEVLDRLQREVDRQGSTRLRALLRPGISRSRAAAMLAGVGLTVPEDLLRLYEWHDGTDASSSPTLGTIWLMPGFYLSSLEDALDNLDAFGSDSRWRPHWLPVFAEGGGDFLVVNCAPTGSEDAGAVVHFRIDELKHPVEYESVGALLETIARAYETGAIHLEDGVPEFDAAAYASIAAKLNPSVKWWTD